MSPSKKSRSGATIATYSENRRSACEQKTLARNGIATRLRGVFAITPHKVVGHFFLPIGKLY